MFTKKLISQSSAVPGCNNTITVTIVQNVPLPAKKSSILITFSSGVHVGLWDGNVALFGADASSFYGNSSSAMSSGMWISSKNSLRLNVASDLPVCTNITFQFRVCNPASAPTPVSQTLLQEARPVNISAEGAGVGIAAVPMDSSHVSLDEQPMRVHAPLFTIKKIGQSTPYPGMNNTITVTIASNFNMVERTKIVMHGFEGAIAVEGDVALSGIDADKFTSVAGTVGHGTWVDCDKALILIVESESGCNISSFVLSFVVRNPLQAQDCMDVRINASVPSPCPGLGYDSFKVTQPRIGSQISNRIGSREMDSFSKAYLAHSEDGFDMDHDLATVLPFFGAMMGDACPLLVWPAAFLLKDISQSSPYPCAVNTISITVASNVRLLTSSRKKASITISNIYMATPHITSVTASRASASGVLTEWPSLFDASSMDAGVWKFNKETNMSSLTLHIKPGVVCCEPDATGNGLTVISFNVTNSKMPQPASKTVSISAAGSVMISAAPMHHDHGNKWAFYVKKPLITYAAVAQTSSAPCTQNTVTLQFKFNSDLLCTSRVTIVGMESVMKYADVKNISGVGYVPGISWESDVLTLPLKENFAKDESLKLLISFFNPGTAVLRQAAAPVVVLIQSEMIMDESLLTVPQNVSHQALTVQGASFSKAIIVQSSPFQGDTNTISITLSTTQAIASRGPCSSVITISGLHGACVSDSTLHLSGDAQVISHDPTSVTGGTALWNNSDSSVIMYVLRGKEIAKGLQYVLHFNITNPSAPQEANAVSISTSGVSIAQIEMDIGADTQPGVVSCNNSACVFPFTYRGVEYNSCTNADYGSKYWCAIGSSSEFSWVECECEVRYETTSLDAAPLHVRGLAEFTTFKIGQSNMKPGQQNIICVTFSTNVPLVSSVPVLVTVSGLTGASASHGSLPLSSDSSQHFSAAWNDVQKRIIFTTVVDTIPSVEYRLCSTVTNARCAQPSPAVYLESSGVVIQSISPTQEPDRQTAVLRIEEPELIDTDIEQLSSTPGGHNELTIRFKSTVNLVYKAGAVTSVVLRGLHGVDLPTGTVAIGGAHKGSFSACNHLGPGCSSASGIWGDSRETLTLYIVKNISAMVPVEIKLSFKNAETLQDGLCSMIIQVHLEEEGCHMLAAPISSAKSLRGTPKEALRIHGSSSNASCFQIKTVTQSTSAPSATNTITVSLRPPVSLSADSTVVISGLVGATTPDAMLRLLNSSTVFRPRARWTSASGTLVLSIATGKTLSSMHTAAVTFDLTNPSYPQETPPFITITVPGHKDIKTCVMETTDDDAAPLHVVSPQFTVRKVGQSSNMPGAANKITVTIKPNVVLSTTRQSVIVVDGLRGSSTVDASSVQVITEQGRGLAPHGTWRQSSGTLSINVDSKIDDSSETVFSFEISNGNAAQSRVVDDVHVMALGMIPIGAAPLAGNVMQIVDLNAAQEVFGVCTCSAISGNPECSCSTTLSDIAQSRALYALKVEMQCNSRAANITISAADVPFAGSLVHRPPFWCHDECQTYHTVLDWTPIHAAVVSSGNLTVEVNADGLQTDYCGAGHHLKALFTIRMSQEMVL